MSEEGSRTGGLLLIGGALLLLLGTLLHPMGADPNDSVAANLPPARQASAPRATCWGTLD